MISENDLIPNIIDKYLKEGLGGVKGEGHVSRVVLHGLNLANGQVAAAICTSKSTLLHMR